MLEDMKAKIIAVDATCITLANPDGSHHTRSVTDKTKVAIDGKDAKLTDLKAGDEVTVSGDPVDGILIGDEPNAPIKPLHASLKPIGPPAKK